MLDDARTEAARLYRRRTPPGAATPPSCWLVGGGEGTPFTSARTSAAKRPETTQFLNTPVGRRVPIYVVAIAPPADDVAPLAAGRGQAQRRARTSRLPGR